MLHVGECHEYSILVWCIGREIDVQCMDLLEWIVPGLACVVNCDVVATMSLVDVDITLRKQYK